GGIAGTRGRAGRGGGAVGGDAPRRDRFLERAECRAHAGQELGAIDLAELGLGVVQVVNVQGFEPEIGAALIDLIAQVARGHAMGALRDVAGLDDPRLDVRRREVRAWIARDGAVEWDESALGRHDDLVALDEATADRGAQRRADRALAALMAIVHRGVEHVDAELQGPDDGVLIEDVGRAVLGAEVGAEAERRGRAAAGQLAEVAGRHASRGPLGVAARALDRRAARELLAGGGHRVLGEATRNEKRPFTMWPSVDSTFHSMRQAPGASVATVAISRSAAPSAASAGTGGGARRWSGTGGLEGRFAMGLLKRSEIRGGAGLGVAPAAGVDSSKGEGAAAPAGTESASTAAVTAMAAEVSASRRARGPRGPRSPPAFLPASGSSSSRSDNRI